MAMQATDGGAMPSSETAGTAPSTPGPTAADRAGPPGPAFPRTRLRLPSRVRPEIDRLLAELRAAAPTGLHLGAGSVRLAGMINADLHNPAADRRLDALDLSEFADGSVDLIEHHHMLEHLSIADTERALAEWARVLRPGGWLVMSCPDLTRLALVYLRDRLIDRVRPWPERIESRIRMFVGSQENEGMFHRNHFDAPRLARLLERHGFALEFRYAYPKRPTPSLLTISRRAPAAPRKPHGDTRAPAARDNGSGAG